MWVKAKLTDFENVLENRRSIRNYSTEAVEFEKLTKIIQAGLKAPNSGEVNEVKYVLVTDDEKKQKIAHRCKGQHWMTEAAAWIVVCAEVEKCEEYFGFRGKRLYTVQNAAVSIQNMLLEAKNQGLDSCWVGSFDEEYLKDKIDIPEGVRPQAIITIGYSDQQPGKRSYPKLSSHVYFDTYGNRVRDLDSATRNYGKKLQKKSQRVKRNIASKNFKEDIKTVFEKIREGFSKLF